MGWQKRLRDIALAGGLAGGCAGTTVVGNTSGSSATGTGGAGGAGGAGGSTVIGPPVCNANPDPCCPCLGSGQGGYGGASCTPQNQSECQAELSCLSTPDGYCCSSSYAYDNCKVLAVCADAGFLDSGC